MNNKQSSKIKGGFTLVEMLVAVSVFSVAVVAMFGLFITAVRGQEMSFASQELLDQASYSMEYMGRALRMASKESATTKGDSCLDSGYGNNYEIINGGNGIRFINHLNNDKCQEFYLNSKNQLVEVISSDHKASNFGSPIPLTSPDLKVTNLKFSVSGESQNDNLQPLVTIILDIQKFQVLPGYNPKIELQTSISQRNLDVQY